jgi:hypothetical protein
MNMRLEMLLCSSLPLTAKDRAFLLSELEERLKPQEDDGEWSEEAERYKGHDPTGGWGRQ